MKNLNVYPLLLFVCITFILGCNEYIDGYQSTWEYQYETAIEKSLKDAKLQNRIFLGFELGMTPAMYNFYQKKLVTTHTFPSVTQGLQLVDYPDATSQGTYKLHLKSGDYDITYQPVFVGQKLVQMNLTLQPEITAKNLTSIYKEILAVYTQKYGKEFIEKKQSFGPNDFFWLQSNRQIKLSRSPFAVEISYSDLNWYDAKTENSDVLIPENSAVDSTIERIDL